MKCDERGNIWVTGPEGRLGDQHLRRAARRSSRCPRRSATTPGAATTGRRCSSRRRARSTRSARRWARAASPTCADALPDRSSAHEENRRWLSSSSIPRARAHDPGHAERRDHRRRRVRRLRLARARDGAERRRERRRARGCGARAAGVPVLHVWYIVEDGAHGPQAERAALPGRQGHGRARARHLGRRAGRGPRAAGGRPRRREDAHERLAGHALREPAARPRARHGDRHRAPGRTCRSSTPRAPAPTRATA